MYIYIYKKVFFHPLDTTLHNQTHLSPQVNFRSAGLPKRIGDQGLTTASKQEKSCKQQRLDNRGFALRWLETHRIPWDLVYYLVGGWNQPIWKIWTSIWIISPNRGENNNYLKPPT